MSGWHKWRLSNTHLQPHNGSVMKLYSISDHFLGEDGEVKSPIGESGMN